MVSSAVGKLQAAAQDAANSSSDQVLVSRASGVEEEQHVGSSASAQTPVPDGLQHLAFCGLPVEEEQHVEGTASAQMLERPDVSSLKELPDTTTLEELSITATSSSLKEAEEPAQDTIKVTQSSVHCLSSTPIWVWQRNDWGFTFYTRKDLGGSFHTYPHVGGPFQSLGEAYNAINRYLEDSRDLTMGSELSRVDKVVRKCLYYPDGTRKKRSKSQPIDERRDSMRQLVQALVDKYNNFHNLLGDLAHELKDVVLYKTLSEGRNFTLYYHINFTTKTKGADDFDNLFFAELISAPGERPELAVNCCCIVKPFDKGYCYGCQNDMKHPNSADAYAAGRLKSACNNVLGLGGPKLELRDCYEDFEAEEARLRSLFRCLDDPDHDEKMRALMASLKFKLLDRTNRLSCSLPPFNVNLAKYSYY